MHNQSCTGRYIGMAKTMLNLYVQFPQKLKFNHVKVSQCHSEDLAKH